MAKILQTGWDTNPQFKIPTNLKHDKEIHSKIPHSTTGKKTPKNPKPRKKILRSKREKKNLDYLPRGYTDICVVYNKRSQKTGLSHTPWNPLSSANLQSFVLKSLYVLKSLFKNKDFQTKHRPSLKKSPRGRFFTTRRSEIQAVSILVI